jgi:hypothetical protein
VPGENSKSTQHHRSLIYSINRPPSHPKQADQNTRILLVYETACSKEIASSIMPGLTSASGVLGFLSDEEPELKVFALQTLNDDIDTLWTEVADSVGQM